jgi:hypothetical protein
MRLPAALPASGWVGYITPAHLWTCWVTGCTHEVDPDDDLGLCEECIRQLVIQTNGGTMQELVA